MFKKLIANRTRDELWQKMKIFIFTTAPELLAEEALIKEKFPVQKIFYKASGLDVVGTVNTLLEENGEKKILMLTEDDAFYQLIECLTKDKNKEIFRIERPKELAQMLKKEKDIGLLFIDRIYNMSELEKILI